MRLALTKPSYSFYGKNKGSLRMISGPVRLRTPLKISLAAKWLPSKVKLQAKQGVLKAEAGEGEKALLSPAFPLCSFHFT